MLLETTCCGVCVAVILNRCVCGAGESVIDILSVYVTVSSPVASQHQRRDVSSLVLPWALEKYHHRYQMPFAYSSGW
jgi:hypothetical protein